LRFQRFFLLLPFTLGLGDKAIRGAVIVFNGLSELSRRLLHLFRALIQQEFQKGSFLLNVVLALALCQTLRDFL
jgi:hypothetical protein